MKNKKLFNLSAIILGVVTLFSCSKVQATESVFSDTIPTRSSAQTYTATAFSSFRTLGISETRESGEAYTWNPNTAGEAKTVWKIADIVADIDSSGSKRNYSNLYYCLNVEIGFGMPDEPMSENKEDQYSTTFDMKDSKYEASITKYAGGDLATNYNQILWVLDNSYIPSKNTNYQSSAEYIKLMNDAGITIDDNPKLNLTEDDIEVVQQMVIWYFTNSSNSTYHNIDLPNLYLDKTEIADIVEQGEYGPIYVGKKRRAKAEALYTYFTGNDFSNYTTVIPTLTLSNSNAKVKEDGNNYIVGPFNLTGTNTNLIKQITTNINVNCTLLDSSKNELKDNVLTGNDFYLKISKDEITESKEIKINLEYKYDVRTLTFLTDVNDSENTQPVVLVKSTEKSNTINTNANIELTEVTVKKVWNDNNNQDGIRPTSVEVQLYKTINGTKTSMGDDYKVTLKELNNWQHTWTNLAKKEAGETIVYSVEEKAISNYTAEYSAEDYSNTDSITITNKYTPGVISKTVIKEWEDSNNKDRIRPEEIKVQLYKTINGTKTSMGDDYKVTLKELNNWQHTWSELPVKENGQTITYTVEEVEVPEGYTVSYSDDTFTITNTHIPKKLDLSLRKFITKVNDVEYSREPIVDTSKLGTVVDGEPVTTATYKHTKEPIAVQKGDIVTYTIRVYNEGEVDGYVDMITDHLPDNLIPIINGIEGIDSEKYKEEIEFNSKYSWIYTDKGNTITTMATSKNNSDIYGMMTGLEKVTDTKLDAYVEDSNKLDYLDVQIKCLVIDAAVSGEYLTNIAEISKMCDADGIEVETDIDSTKSNADYSDLETYKNQEAISSDINTYVPGQEDDDDFEKLVVKEFDLALRKFITKVNETSYSREPVVDTSKLRTTVDGKTITTAIYNHSKEPVIVERGDLVTYKIRIYNEGTLDGFVNEITDNIPEGLEFLPDSSVNVSYKWRMIDSEGNETEDVSKAVMIVTNYLSDNDKNNVINAVSDVEGVKTLSYKDVEVQFKVIAKAEKLKDNLVINEAQISSDSDRDIDSVPNRDEKYNYTTGKNEDDIDYEPIKLKYFDLALKKFVTGVNSIKYNNRYPEIIYNEDGSITYNHTKDPVLVTTGDIVVYTIRVYNEGEKAGTATKITDNLPEGLEFLTDNEINKQYGWKLLDEEGNITEDITKAKKFTTEALKDERIDALIIKDGQKVLSYKDVQIAFKIVEPNTSSKILINIAEISEDSDDDVDSTPENGIETEDDTDKEYVKVQYFDLSLKKWVTKTQVTYNGKTTTTKTGFTEDSDGIAKVDLVASKMKKATVKFVYSIKVTNEGELPGYAYEIKDYIPKGLEFVKEDNQDWKELKDGIVVTDKLKDTLLNPGESTTVEIVLTWKNSTTNTGLKTNYAEISEDSADDIDSTPDNYNLKEDDIDDAQVLLSIKTAGAKTYIGLVLLTVTILAGGIFLIKKYVIK